MPENVVGPQIRKLRYRQSLTQDALAARCARLGWDVSRGTVAKVEAQVRCVSDSEMLVFARALKVGVDALYPPTGKTQR